MASTLSNEVGIAFDAPAPEWSLKCLSMSAILAPPPPRQRLPPRPDNRQPPLRPRRPRSATAPKPAAPAAATPKARGASRRRRSRRRAGHGNAEAKWPRPGNCREQRTSLFLGGFQRVDVNLRRRCGPRRMARSPAEMSDLQQRRPSFLVNGSVSRGLDMPQQNDWFGGAGGRPDGHGRTRRLRRR